MLDYFVFNFFLINCFCFVVGMCDVVQVYLIIMLSLGSIEKDCVISETVKLRLFRTIGK